jgi:hypothetical protein
MKKTDTSSNKCSIPIPRCPCEACLANCKTKNCLNNKVNNKVDNCEKQCKDFCTHKLTNDITC